METSSHPQQSISYEVSSPAPTHDSGQVYSNSYQAPYQNHLLHVNQPRHHIPFPSHNSTSAQTENHPQLPHQTPPQNHATEYSQHLPQNQMQGISQDLILYVPQNQAPKFATSPNFNTPNHATDKPTTVRQKYYKPMSTGSPVLIAYLVASLIFLAGLEVVSRRGVPLTASTTTTTISNSTKIGRRSLSSSTMPECIGVEVILSVTAVENCERCASTTTYQKPIFDVPIPTMPCYVCAMEEQKIKTEGWITATTTRCASCNSQSPATIYPCSTCEGTILTATPTWETTPTLSMQPYTTYGKHTHNGKHPAHTMHA